MTFKNMHFHTAETDAAVFFRMREKGTALAVR
jgi:hypothetical protein